MNSLEHIPRRILSVVGPHSNCGKTLFVLHLLRRFAGLGCLKISPAVGRAATSSGITADSVPEFHFENDACLDRLNSDTAQYRAAGAAAVERLRHRGRGLSTGLVAAFNRFPANMPLIVESSSAVPLLKPAAVVLVIRPPVKEMKPATCAILNHVTDLLVNAAKEDADSEAATVERTIRQLPDATLRCVWRTDLGCAPLPATLIERLGDILGAELR